MSDVPTDPALRDLLMTATRTLRRRWHATLGPWELSPHEHRALHVVGHSPSRCASVTSPRRCASRRARPPR